MITIFVGIKAKIVISETVKNILIGYVKGLATFSMKAVKQKKGNKN